MGNFEKLSVLVIGVIIVMILVVAIFTWTGNPDETGTPVTELVPTDSGTLPSGALASSSVPRNWSKYDDPVVAPTDIEKVIVTDVGTLEPKPTEKVAAVVKTEAEALVAPSALTATEETYEIQSNDTLGLISQKFYGTTKYWPKIAERNDLVPERLRVGKKIFIPAIDAVRMAKGPGTATAKVATHAGGAKPGAKYTVRGGETIQQISRAAYGTIERWVDIYVGNLEVVNNPSVLSAGTVLRLPE